MSLTRYTDNTIAFTGIPVTWASFNVSNFSIPVGEDDDTLNKIGDVHFREPDGLFHFQSGQDNSFDVAEWWSEHIRPGQNTFKLVPTWLNSAFLGELSFSLQDRQKTLTLKDIGIAQGHTGLWWFGGSHCTHFGKDQVTCSATDAAGVPHLVTFEGDGHSIQVEDVSLEVTETSVKPESRHVEKRMTYRDNAVNLRGIYEVPFSNSTFVVKDFKVSAGQDPDGHIHAGLVVKSDDRNALRFSCGRHGTTEVAAWWANWFPDYESTFQHQPGHLNFAVRGDLYVATPNNTFTLTGIGLAQGHVFANNWWFAGWPCHYVGKVYDNESEEQVGCHAVDENGSPWTLTFWRGGFGDWQNDIKITSIRPGQH